MQATKEKVLKDSYLRKYSELINKIAKVEYKTLGAQHLIEFDELVNIGFQTVNILFSNGNISAFNESYISTAIKWAIRNELRHRYKWYTLKHKKEDGENLEYATDSISGANSDDSSEDMGFSISPTKVREAVYETILSIDGLAAAATDNASPFDFIKDPSAMPDEKAEIVEMSRLIKQAIAKLPQKERTVVEYRFYRNMQAKDIATMVGLSPSRITRIVQFSLNQIREYLKSRGREDY